MFDIDRMLQYFISSACRMALLPEQGVALAKGLVGPVLASASCHVCIVKDVKAWCVRKIISEHRHLFYLAYQSQSYDEVQKPSQKKS